MSFDRPYPQTWASGAADFVGNELPLLFHLESLGLDMTYWTDVDLHAQPELLMNHRCLFSLGHDEYWSQPMRQGAATANAAGVNLAFLGANACYRQIRLQPTSVGPNRLQVCYKDADRGPDHGPRGSFAHDGQLDPGAAQRPRVDPHRLHVPVGRRQGRHGGHRRVVVVLRRVQPRRRPHLQHVILGEYDRYVPSLPGPKNADVLAHSPIPGQVNWSDTTYYTAPGNGGGVLASGSASFVSLLGKTGVDPAHTSSSAPFPA